MIFEKMRWGDTNRQEIEEEKIRQFQKGDGFPIGFVLRCLRSWSSISFPVIFSKKAMDSPLELCFVVCGVGLPFRFRSSFEKRRWNSHWICASLFAVLVFHFVPCHLVQKGDGFSIGLMLRCLRSWSSISFPVIFFKKAMDFPLDLCFVVCGLGLPFRCLSSFSKKAINSPLDLCSFVCGLGVPFRSLSSFSKRRWISHWICASLFAVLVFHFVYYHLFRNGDGFPIRFLLRRFRSSSLSYYEPWHLAKSKLEKNGWLAHKRKLMFCVKLSKFVGAALSKKPSSKLVGSFPARTWVRGSVVINVCKEEAPRFVRNKTLLLVWRVPGKSLRTFADRGFLLWPEMFGATAKHYFGSGGWRRMVVCPKQIYIICRRRKWFPRTNCTDGETNCKATCVTWNTIVVLNSGPNRD